MKAVPAAGSWSVRTIYLPDSLVGLFSPSCLAYNPQQNTVLGCGQDDMMVFDAAGGRRLVRIPTPAGISPKTVVSVCYVPGWDKFYVAYTEQWLSHNGYLVVVDGATNRVTRVLADLVCRGSRRMCYSPVSNKLYVAGGDSMMVVDVARDSIVAYPRVGPVHTRDVCYNSRDDKVYCANWMANTVTVIAAANDSVLAVIPVGEMPVALCYDAADNKVYSANYGRGVADSTVSVIDGAGDSVLAVVHAGPSPLSLAWNPAANEVYVGTGEGLAVVSGGGDTLVARISTMCEPSSICAGELLNKVYYAERYGNGFGIVDGASHEVIAALRPQSDVAALCLADSGRTVFAAGHSSGEVLTVDGEGDSIAGRELVGFRPVGVCLNARRDKLYCTGDGVPFLFVVDARTDSVRGRVGLGEVREFWMGEHAMVCDTARDKLYVAGEESLTVICGATDSVLTCLDIEWIWPEGLPRLWLAPGRPYLYCGGNERLAVLDTRADSFVRDYPVGNLRVGFPGISYDHASDRLFYAGSDSAIAIDTHADTVVATFSIGAATVDDRPLTCCNTTNGKVYFSGQDSVAIFSGLTGMRLRALAVAGLDEELADPAFNAAGNKVYWPRNGGLAVIDGDRDSIIRYLDFMSHPAGLVWDSARNLVYCLDDGGSLSVLDGRTDEVVSTFGTGPGPVSLAVDRASGRGFTANNAGASVTVVDLVVGTAERPAADAGRRRPGATVVRGVLRMASDECRLSSCGLLDATGRKVLDLKPGENDVRHLAPGVYFVRRTSCPGREASGVRRVVVQR